MQQHSRTGFTLIELMIVIAIIAVVAAIAIPALLRARVAANETSAIGTLRSLATAQLQFQSSGAVDQDADGTGEFGWLQELAGTSGLRDSYGGVTTGGVSPPFITSVLGSSAAGGNGLGEHSGYKFKVYLPVGSGSMAMGEDSPPPTFMIPDDANPQENRFMLYSWPGRNGGTGVRTFAVSQEGQVVAYPNAGYPSYDGDALQPGPEAAIVATGAENPYNLEGAIRPGLVAGNGQEWYAIE